MSKPFAPRSNNYLTTGRPFPKQQSLIHTTANSLRYPSSNSSYSLKNERKEQSVNKSPITKNSISTENNSHPANLERCSKDIESPNRIFTMQDSIQRSGTENNSCSSNTKKCSRDVENLSNRSSAIHNLNSVENNSRSITIRKNSIEVENSSENSTIYSSNSVKNVSRPVNLRKSSTGVQDPSTNSAINHSRPTNLKKPSMEAENSSRISTTHITKRSSEVENLRRNSNNFNGVENNLLPKKRSAEVENNANHPKKYSKVEGPNVNSTIHSRPTNIRKPSIEAENSNRISTTHIAKRSSEVENLRRNSTNNLDSVENNSRANHPKKNSKVEDSSVNSTANQSRPTNLKKSSMKAENSRRISTTRIFTAKRFSEVENPRRNSTTINHDSVGSMEVDNNANHPKQRPEVENPGRRFTIHNPVQRDGTKNNIRTTNRSVNLVRRNGMSNDSRATNPQHSRKPVNSLFPVGLDRFSSQALNKKVKNKELSKSEWENIRLIKAALINLVESSQKYRKIESGKFVWSKINEWVYKTFYPDLNEYLDKKHINRENAGLVIKAIMDYYVSRHDRYMKQVRKTK